MQKRVHILVPSGKIDFHMLDGARQRLEAWGYRVTESAHARMPQGRFGGSEADRIADLTEAFTDPDIQYILCARGGYGIAQIVDSLPLPTNKARLIGFSDVTALHCLLGKNDIPSIHAVMAKHLTEYDTHRESCDTLRALMEGQPLHYELPPHPLNRPGRAEGMLRGGNLSVFYGLQGTPYAVRTDGRPILFIEDVGERPYAIDRMMQNLRLSGVLSRLGGLVVGQFSDYEEDPLMGATVYERIREMVEPYDYPLLFGFPAGHVERNLPLVMNSLCKLVVSEDSCSLCQN